MCLTLRGHTTVVSGLTYSPDGRRLVTAAGGTNRGGERLSSEVKIWDAINGQEILSLRGTLAQYPLVAFDRVGRRLAASGDHAVTIWEGSLWTRSSPNAAGRKPGQVPVHAIVDPAAGVGPSPERHHDQRCRAAASPYPGRAVLAKPGAPEAENLVLSLFGKPLFRSEVLVHLRAVPSASRCGKRLWPWRSDGWSTRPDSTDQPGSRLADGRGTLGVPLGVERAEIACRLMPFESSYHTTLGMAQYRLGKYQEALTTLTRADQLNQTAHGGHAPADLAFLTMTRYQMMRRTGAVEPESIARNDAEAEFGQK